MTQFRTEFIKPTFLIDNDSTSFLDDRGRDGLRNVESVFRIEATDNPNTCIYSGDKLHYFGIQVLRFGDRLCVCHQGII
jgi:hypothetical protein